MLLDEARERVAAIWRCQPAEVLFTSSATESNNLAVLGVAGSLANKGRHVVTSAIEHPAVLEPCRHLVREHGFEVTFVEPQSSGVVEVGAVRAALRADTVLVSVMAANNEIGTVQPVAAIGEFCRSRGVLFHTDAAQWMGKEPFATIDALRADLVSASAHKFYGPRGAGALFVRAGTPLQPRLWGGGQENDRRAGTENLAAIVGFALATERFLCPPVFPRQRLEQLTAPLLRLLDRLPGVTLHGARQHCLANTVAFTVEGCDALSLLAGLDLEGICASSGSACTSGSLVASHVLLALGLPVATARSLIRLSFGRESTPEEVAYIAAHLPMVIDRIRESQ